jgi:Sulfotransferase family
MAIWETARVSEQPSPSAPGPARPARPTILYVMGAGRSGSTILGVALGNCDGVFFAGELDRWLARAGRPRGDGAERERFWAQVRGHVSYPPELAGRTTWLERSSSLLDPRRWRARRRLRSSYRRVSADLYGAVADVANASHVVDTSHYPMRARELQALGDIELHLLLLVRDPSSVVASLGRADVRERRFRPLRANAYLWLTNLLSLVVFLRHPAERRVLVRYEDLLAAPERVLADILARCHAHASPPDVTRLRTGAPFHGNRLVEAEVVSLERSAPRRARHASLTALAQSPWSLLFRRLDRAGAGDGSTRV